MTRFLIHTLLTLLANAVGLIIAAITLPSFHIQPLGFIVSVLFFTGVDTLLKPFIVKLSVQYMPALRGGIALVTTFVGLLLTVIFTNGLRIDDIATWIAAPLVIWLVVVLAGIVLPLFLFKEVLSRTRDSDRS